MRRYEFHRTSGMRLLLCRSGRARGGGWKAPCSAGFFEVQADNICAILREIIVVIDYY